MDETWEHHDVNTNGIRLHVVQAGPVNGPLVILLHGFPEFWYGWHKQIDALAQAGYRVWVPDQRGYNLSDKPGGIAAYNINNLAGDVAGLIKAAGREKASVVGHDWGAAVAWWLAGQQPDVLDRLVVLNVPHGAVMMRQLRRSPRQLLKSAYIFFFQIPRLPEALSRWGNWWMPTRALTLTSRKGAFTHEDLLRYREAWAQSGAYTAMLNWYRALLQKRPPMPADPRIYVPTLLLWGVKDRFLGREMAQPSIDLCEKGKLVFLENATHWIQHDEPEQVNALLLEFLRK